MAEGTSLSITLKADSLIDELDKAAAQFEIFSKKAEDSIKLVGTYTNEMSQAQKRAYDVIKKSYDDHAKSMKDLSGEYESLRAKQKRGEELTQSECARLQQLTSEFKKHRGAITSNASELGKLGKEYAKLKEHLQDSTNRTTIFNNAIIDNN